MMIFTKSSLSIAISITTLLNYKKVIRKSTTSCNHSPNNNLINHSIKYKTLSLKDKVVLITGATSGIGKACAFRFADEQSKLVLIGRRLDKLNDVKNELLTLYPNIKIYIQSVDVTDYKQLDDLPSQLPIEFKDVDILVNNAGLALGVTSVDQNSIIDAKTVIDTNVLGVIALCSLFVPGMKARGSGHIINMGSVAGHHAYLSGSVYNASKYAVHGFTSAARHDLAGTPIRVTHISPGMVGNTEFSTVRLGSEEKAKAVYDNIVALTPEDVADNVIYAATRPAHVQIADIIVYATNQSGPRDIVRAGANLGAPIK